MPCGWESNRMSGVTLATRQTLVVLRLRAQGLGERDEHPPTLSCGAWSTLPFYVGGGTLTGALHVLELKLHRHHFNHLLLRQNLEQFDMLVLGLVTKLSCKWALLLWCLYGVHSFATSLKVLELFSKTWKIIWTECICAKCLNSLSVVVNAWKCWGRRIWTADHLTACTLSPVSLRSVYRDTHSLIS